MRLIRAKNDCTVESTASSIFEVMYLYDGVAIFRTDLVSGNALLIALLDDFPIQPVLHEFVAFNALHGNVIVIDLTYRGNAV